MNEEIEKGAVVYYVKKKPRKKLHEATVRTVYEKVFIGTDKDSKRAVVFNMEDLGKRVFLNLEDAEDFCLALDD